MKIKELLNSDAGFQYIIDSMDLMSAAGRRAMLEAAFRTSAPELEEEWDRLEDAIRATNDIPNRRYYIDLRHCLMCLHDLSGTFASLANHMPLNEVELFEIKSLCSLSRSAATAAPQPFPGSSPPAPKEPSRPRRGGRHRRPGHHRGTFGNSPAPPLCNNAGSG